MFGVIIFLEELCFLDFYFFVKIDVGLSCFECIGENIGWLEWCKFGYKCFFFNNFMCYLIFFLKCFLFFDYFICVLLVFGWYLVLEEIYFLFWVVFLNYLICWRSFILDWYLIIWGFYFLWCFVLGDSEGVSSKVFFINYNLGWS